MKFKNFLESQSKINQEWDILVLDDKSELMTNVKLLNKHKIQIMKHGSKVVELSYKEDILSVIEKYLGYKLNLKDKKVKEFLKLFPNR